MSKNTDLERGHSAEYDGIEEYDNPLPDWWVGMFVLCSIWAVIYGVNFHFVAGDSQEKWYDEEVALAKATWPELDKKAAFDDKPETLAKGKEAFEKNCVSCHTPALTGGIGPNLIDDRWIHGSEFEKITATIDAGVSAKGMPAWGPILGPQTIAAVASYVLSKNEGEAGRAKTTAIGAYAEGASASGGAAGGATAAPATPGAPAAPAASVKTAELTPENLAAGEKVFTEKCVVCHKADMTGLVGPNLVDETWIHGGELAQIQATIINGVPEKGMITWKGQLSDDQIAQVAAYVYSKSHPSK